MSRDTGSPRRQPFAAAADFIVRMHWAWLGLAAVLVALSLARIQGIMPPEADARIFFGEDNPDRMALDAFEGTFSRADNLMIVIEARNGEVFEPAVLAAVGEITERAWRLPFVRRIDSVTNFQHTRADGDDLTIRDLIEDPAGVTPEQAASAREIALSEDELVHRIIAPSSDVTMVHAMLTLPLEDPAGESPAIVAQARELERDMERKYPELDIRLTGSVVSNNQFLVSAMEDGETLVPSMFLAVLLIVWLSIRSFFGTLSTLAVLVCAALAGLGTLGWMGLKLNSVTVMAPLCIMTLAVASAVHVLSACRQHMAETADRKEWVRRALTEHMGAIVVACVTTAIGFFSLNFSISPPIRQLGNANAVGVLATMVYTLTLLPALIILLPFRRRTDRVPAGRAMDRIAEFVIARRRVLLPAFAVAAVAIMAGMTRLALEDDLLRYFDERYEFRQDVEFTEERLTGILNLDFQMRSGEPGGINDPAFLAEASSFVDWLREQPEVTYVYSPTDIIARLNMSLHGDDPSYRKLPATRDEVAELLFLYELGLGYGMDLNDFIDIDRETLRVSVFMAKATTAQMRDMTFRTGAWLRDNAPIVQKAWEEENPDIALVTPTGLVHMFNLIAHRDVRNMLTGTVLALVLISAILMLVLRNVKIGLISLIPNLIPGAMAFGLWGYGVGTVTMAIAAVLAATLGIVVDDTVHFLSSYCKARKDGLGSEDAVRHAFRSVGSALAITTVSLVAGFAILAQSGLATNSDMAALTAITVTLALLADFLFLPCLLIRLDGRPSVIPSTR